MRFCPSKASSGAIYGRLIMPVDVFLVCFWLTNISVHRGRVQALVSRSNLSVHPTQDIVHPRMKLDWALAV